MTTALRLLCIAVLVTVAAHAQSTTIASDWVFVSSPLRWESPPLQAKLPIHTAPATIVVIYPDGRYAALACLLIKQKDGRITISNGDGFVVHIGAWSDSGGKLVANSSVVFRSVALVRKAAPETPQIQQFMVKQVNGHRELYSGGKKYAPLPHFTDLNNLANIVRMRTHGPSSQQ